jgi:hypothetical protein
MIVVHPAINEIGKEEEGASAFMVITTVKPQTNPWGGYN